MEQSMSDNSTPMNNSWIATSVGVGKDFVSLLRDGALLFLAVLLVVFPGRLNSILVDAGFEEGSIVGFKWKSKLIDSNRALEEAQATISTLQSKNDELLKALTEANAKANDPKLLERLAKLETENRNVKNTTEKVQTVVSQTIESNTPLVEKALSSSQQQVRVSRSKSDYSVGLQTLGVPDQERVAINEKIRSEGYGLDPITWSYPANERPSWFSDRSAVFYYSESSRPVAEQLALFLKSITGQEFVVRRGAGLGVEPSRKDVMLFVHYIKK